MKNRFLFILLLLFPCMSLHGQESQKESFLAIKEKNYKIHLRGVGSTFLITEQTSGNNSTQTAVLMGMEVGGQYFIDNKHSVGIGVETNFNLAYSVTNLYAVKVFTRRYFWSSGISEQIQIGNLQAEVGDKFGFYGIGSLELNSYVVPAAQHELFEIEDDLGSDDIKGGNFSIRAGAGLDYRLNSGYELNTEFTSSMATFSSSNTEKLTADTYYNIFVGMSFSY